MNEIINTLFDNRYALGSEIGRGGMGVVYRATDTLLARDVAVKLVATGDLGSEGRGRLIQEARAAAGLNHPNIVSIYDVGETELADSGEKAGFIVMEYVEGRSLHNFQPESIAQFVDIGRQMSAALEQAHQKGIIHRDLKPDNVIITPSGQVKLMDFGLARVSGGTRRTQEGTLMGTLSYLAPEIILGQPSTARSDLYALGVIFYELAAGRPPFEGETPTAILSQHLNAPVVPPSRYNESLPRELETLIIRLLAKRPEDRPSSAAEVGQALEKASLSDPEFHAVGSPSRQMSSQINQLVRGRLVGREEEFEQAIAAWQRAVTGQGGVLLISGEPGIGKTRLAKELIAYAEVRGGLVLTGECYAEGGLPCMPISQLIRDAFNNGTAPKLSQPVLLPLLDLAPELAANLPEKNLIDVGPTEFEQQRLFDSMATLCISLAEKAPLLIFVDDIHWGDSCTVAIVRHLARRLRDRRALIVATYREIELDKARPFQDMLADLTRERLSTRLKLTRLSPELTGDLLATLFDEDVTPEFLDAVYHETEGNPFFVEEISRALIDSGDLYFQGGRWHRPETTQMTLPQGVRMAIQSRLGRLDKKVQNVLQIAALLGREFRYDMLAAVSDEEEDKVITALEEAEAAQLIEEINSPGRALGQKVEPRFSFTHALIHTALVSGLSTLRRQRMVRAIAPALENDFPDERLELAPLLGRFFGEAGEGQKASRYFMMAGDQAHSLYAYGEAAGYYEKALLYLRKGENLETAARTLTKLGSVYHANYDFEKSQEAYEEGFALWRQVGDTIKKGGNGPPKADHPLRQYILTKSSNLDPTRNFDVNTVIFIRQLFSGLVDSIRDEIIPDIASSWEVLEGGRRYVFHLRDDVQWSDGQPVTADDFIYAWMRTLDPAAGSIPAKLLYDIRGAQDFNQGRDLDPEEVGVQVIDDHTLLVELNEPVGYFLQALTHSFSYPIPKHKVEALGDAWADPKNLIGNGPFTISQWDDDFGYEMIRNPNYHGPVWGNVQKIRWRLTTEDTIGSLYNGNEIDYLFTEMLPQDEKRRMIRRYPGERLLMPATGTWWLTINTSRPPFDDLRVRRALAMAIDKKKLIRSIVTDILPATGGLIPPGIPGHNADIGLPFQPARARGLLAEAGFSEGVNFPPFTLSSLTEHINQRLAEEVIGQFQENLGLEANLRLRPLGEYWQIRGDNLQDDIFGFSWAADFPDPINFLRDSDFQSTANWVDEEYEALVEQARRINDREERVAKYKEAETRLMASAVVIPIAYMRMDILSKPWVKNLFDSFLVSVSFKDVVIEPHE